MIWLNHDVSVAKGTLFTCHNLFMLESPPPIFTKAIVRLPCPDMVHGITTASLGKPDYEKALDQHAAYVEALRTCGLDVTVLEPDNDFPDSTFVEDTALLTPTLAIITNPGALSRNGEVVAMKDVVETFYDEVVHIDPPGTLEGGDVMMVGPHFYIGLSERTNGTGAAHLVSLLEKHKMTGQPVTMKDMLHLKTGVSYLEHGKLLVMGEFVDKLEFRQFDQIEVDPREAYAANSVWINGKVLTPAGFPNTQKAIEKAGYETLTLEMSEFQKLDGGLSCLSLRF